MYVCVCNAVTEAHVRGCVAAGAASAKEVRAACGMRPGCGTCTKRLFALVSEGSDLVDEVNELVSEVKELNELVSEANELISEANERAELEGRPVHRELTEVPEGSEMAGSAAA